MSAHWDGFGIALEGAFDRMCGRPISRNPYCLENAAEAHAAWTMGWREFDWYFQIRGQDEAARWLAAAS